MLELVEMEMRELLTTYGFEGDETPIILGSALCALEGKRPEIGAQKVDELLKAVDEWIPTPVRETEKPFLMSIEDVFSIPGRGTVASGRVERGTLKKDSDVELVGKLGAEPIKTKVTDIETFKKSCDESRAGDNSGLLLRGIKREDVRRGMVITKPGTTKAHKLFLCSMYVLTKEEGGRHTGFHDNYRPQLFIRTAGTSPRFFCSQIFSVRPSTFPCFNLHVYINHHLPRQMKHVRYTGPKVPRIVRRKWSCQAITSRCNASSTALSQLRRDSDLMSAREDAPSPLVWWPKSSNRIEIEKRGSFPREITNN